MLAAVEQKLFNVVVTGDFDAHTYAELLEVLASRGHVVDSFFSRKAERLPAAATFHLLTEQNVQLVRVLLDPVCARHELLIEELDRA